VRANLDLEHLMTPDTNAARAALVGLYQVLTDYNDVMAQELCFDAITSAYRGVDWDYLWRLLARDAELELWKIKQAEWRRPFDVPVLMKECE
jgi:hypothetical protein